MRVFATEVFTPNDFPTHSYVARMGESLEKELRQAFQTPKVVISIAGPSKSGKTVLVEKVVGKDELIPVSGIELKSDDDLWTCILSWMGAPVTRTAAAGSSTSNSTTGEVSGKGSILVVEASGKASYQHTSGVSDTATESRSLSTLADVVREIGNSSFVVFVDDFHYIPEDAQIPIARQLKAAAEKGVKCCVATVPHRADNVVRQNAELRGRLAQVDTTYWSIKELEQIAINGFRKLLIELDTKITRRLATEACGSPQLMQRICLDACFHLGIEKEANEMTRVAVTPEQVRAILERASTHADFSTMISNMHQGPKTRGQERREHRLDDGSEGDVYRVLLRAIASGEPRMDLPYDALIERIQAVCVEAPPAVPSVIRACRQADTIARRLAPNERIIEWDDNDLGGTLSIVDPYFLFYLRSSRKLKSLGASFHA